jgi:predicted transcriptional regulator
MVWRKWKERLKILKAKASAVRGQIVRLVDEKKQTNSHCV